MAQNKHHGVQNLSRKRFDVRWHEVECARRPASQQNMLKGVHPQSLGLVFGRSLVVMNRVTSRIAVEESPNPYHNCPANAPAVVLASPQCRPGQTRRRGQSSCELGTEIPKSVEGLVHLGLGKAWKPAVAPWHPNTHGSVG